VQVLWNSSPEKPQIRTSLPPFWTVLSSPAPFSWRHSVRKILSKWLPKSFLATTLDYGCSWAILFWARHAPNSERIAFKIVKWIIPWKNRFCRPCKGCQVSGRFFSFPPISSRTEWRHINTAWLRRQFQDGGLRSHFFWNEFLQDSGHFFRDWNFGEWKSRMLTCYRQVNFFGVTSFKYNLWNAAVYSEIVYLRLHWIFISEIFLNSL